jgi:hypothetical protein
MTSCVITWRNHRTVFERRENIRKTPCHAVAYWPCCRTFYALRFSLLESPLQNLNVFKVTYFYQVLDWLIFLYPSQIRILYSIMLKNYNMNRTINFLPLKVLLFDFCKKWRIRIYECTCFGFRTYTSELFWTEYVYTQHPYFLHSTLTLHFNICSLQTGGARWRSG